MTWFPLVSRERLEEKVRELDALRADLTSVRQRNEQLWNFITWRLGGGAAVDLSLLPEEYRPKLTPAATEGVAVKAPVVLPKRNVRHDIAQFEDAREQELRKQDFRGPAPRPDADHVRVMKVVNEAANEGLAAGGRR